jgi:hypothetical protein
VIDKYRNDEPQALARWLLQCGEAGQILKLPANELRGDETLYLAYLQALIDQESYEEAKEWLATPHPKLDGALIDALLAGIAFKVGDGTGRVARLENALKRAEFMHSYGLFSAILQVARRLGDREAVRTTCGRVAKLPPRYLPATRELVFLDLEFGADPAFLEDFHQRMEASRPDDPLARCNLALIRVMRGTDSGKSIATLEGLAHDHPGNLTFQCALALAYLVQNRGEDALALLRAQEVNWNAAAGAFDKAAFAHVLAAQGEQRTADDLRRTINWDQVPEYQRRFFGASVE